ncbi:period circadian protein isoform X3 [Battus philenor]|uniref:period circadian protein isoform X3 n=1 Tax=Battus philenor TaxID=42288 RepID=UPI0035CF5D23
MDNMDDSENNAKISDSAYSNSCSNSQSRRSSKSTHSGSNSSGSSGYGGKPSTSSYSNNLTQPPENRIKEKDSKKKKSQTEKLTTEARNENEGELPGPAPIFETPKEVTDDGDLPSPALDSSEKGPESMDIATPDSGSTKEEIAIFGPCATSPANVSISYVTSRPPTICSDGFSCVISMHDGVVMYTTPSLTTTLGFPKDMWIGRSFIDFVHPRDRNAFASQITNGLALPKNLNGTQRKVQPVENVVSPMVCRIRRYKDLASGFAVKNTIVTYMPFLLKLSFKNVNNEEGDVTYLVLQATPFFSAFKTPNECVAKPVPFIIRHAANGNLEYLDPESVPYLGYLPQDITDKDALHLYHPNDLVYLRQIYETIVKEGASPRSKPYRMMAQNGDYIRLETEWSSFINPWSKKLEFVIGKHHIIEGPANPDVFQSPEPNKALKLTDEEKIKAHSLRESILKILNEALTKPAEAAKQQMSKRCQDLASFMESLLEDQPKNDEDMRLDIQDQEHSYYERDSVMLGGISPHHDHNDSKSSTETPVSYNQLNYNETLQRYFESHSHYSGDDYNTPTGENVLCVNNLNANAKATGSMSADTGDSGDCDSSPALMRGVSPLVPLGDYHPVRLTESRLSKHNAEMEKELVKMHRENRSSKGDKEKKSSENRQKKKEHLARCNASYQPTSAGMNLTDSQPHGVKRHSKHSDPTPGMHKHHCSSSRQTRRRHPTSSANPHPAPIPTSSAASTPWATPMSNMNGFVLGVGMPQQMSIVSPMATMQGMFPMHYVPTHGHQMPMTTNNPMPGNSSGHYQAPAMMMYGQPIYGQPFVYSPIGPQVPYPLPQGYMPAMQYMNTANTAIPLGLACSNYVEACKPTLPPKPAKTRSGNIWSLQRDVKKRGESQATSSKPGQRSLMSNSSANESNRSARAGHESEQSRKAKAMQLGNSEETLDKTDEESSYSSFYSSFFKTESGSAEESSEPKKQNVAREKSSFGRGSYSHGFDTPEAKSVPRRKMEPPWMEQVCVTSELIYKYQVLTKSMEEVLASDLEKMKTFEQPSLVNEQLGQLYLDLQLEGVAARLTLEEGITSSSSSGEETTEKVFSARRKKKEYSKLVMIYEENAPLPPPDASSSSAF